LHVAPIFVNYFYRDQDSELSDAVGNHDDVTPKSVHSAGKAIQAAVC